MSDPTRPHASTAIVPPHRLPGTRAAVALRTAAIAVVAVALVLAVGGPGAYWLCLPGVLLASTLPATPPGMAAGGAAVALAAGTALAWRAPGELPAAGLLVLVPAGCLAVLVILRQRFERERDALRDVALTDALTGVANRRMLFARAEYEVARHTRDASAFALVMLDLNGFKRLNDRFGHAAGDEILCDVAAALAGALRAQDTVARLGGDEFCVLAPDTDRAGVAPLHRRIAAAVGEATTGVVGVSASAGIAVFPEDGRLPAELIEAADQRLLEVKRDRGAHRGRRPARAA